MITTVHVYGWNDDTDGPGLVIHTTASTAEASAELADEAAARFAARQWPHREAPEPRRWVSLEIAPGSPWPTVDETAVELYVGRHIADVDDQAVTAPLALLRAAGMTSYEDAEGHQAFAVLPLADGSQIIVSGTTAARRGRPSEDLRIHHPVRDHASWQACRDDGQDAEMTVIYNSDGQNLPYVDDTMALVAAVIACARQHGVNSQDAD